MTSSSSSSTPKFDVFLSCAEDTRKGLVSHLYLSLSQRGITTYLSDDKLEKRASSLGSEFSDICIESKVAIVVVSQSYPTSVWCLNELQTILDICKKSRLLVLPIFYGVNISDVRRRTGEFAEPFRKLGEGYPEKVEAWTTALIELTNRHGLDLHSLSDEAEMVEIITTKVEAMLIYSDIPSNQRLPLRFPFTTKISGLVGLDRQMQALHQLLDLYKSYQEVRLIGIWGPGGVGKTTLARFAYEDLSKNFHAHVFVDKAENIYQQDPDGSSSRETFTSREIQEGDLKMIRSSNVSTSVIKSTVGHRKSLLVIDCVDNLVQLKDIAEIVGWCGSGSRVILITQDKNLLDEFGVEHIYEVKSLRYDEALQLFSQYAFRRQNYPSSFESLSRRAVQIASFLPLTLKILGSSLHNKNEEEWEKELQKLEGDQEKTIIEIMKKSYTREDEKDQIPSFVLPYKLLL